MRLFARAAFVFAGLVVFWVFVEVLDTTGLRRWEDTLIAEGVIAYFVVAFARLGGYRVPRRLVVVCIVALALFSLASLLADTAAAVTDAVAVAWILGGAFCLRRRNTRAASGGDRRA